MHTIETTADVSADHRLSIDVQLPADIPPGPHRVVVVIDESRREAKGSLDDFPVIDVGPWPKGLSLRREDLYGDDGR